MFRCRPAANQTRTLENYKKLAAAAPANLAGDAVSGAPTTPDSGSTPETPSSTGTPESGSNNGGSGADSGSSDSSPTTSSGAPVNTGAAGALRVGQALGWSAIVAMGFAVLM